MMDRASIHSDMRITWLGASGTVTEVTANGAKILLDFPMRELNYKTEFLVGLDALEAYRPPSSRDLVLIQDFKIQDFKTTTQQTIVKPARSYCRWTRAELQYLANHYGLVSDRVLANRLQRTESAIVIAAERRLLRRKDNFYTAKEAARALSLSRQTVTRWAKRGWLKGRKPAMQQRAVSCRFWRFTEAGIVRCLRRRPWLVDIQSMPEHYFRSVVKREWERDPWCTAEKAAPLLGVGESSVYRYIQAGWLPAEKREAKPHGHAWVIRRSAIRAFLENDPRPQHRHTAMSADRLKRIIAAGNPARRAVIWLIKCPSCGEQVKIIAPPQLHTLEVRDMFIRLYVNGNCEHGSDCLISLNGDHHLWLGE